MKLADCHRLHFQVADLKRQLRKERNHADASAQKAQSLEPQLRECRQQIVELNDANDRAGQIHQEHIDAAEQKFRALMSVCRRQEAHIVDLYKTLEEQQFKNPSDSLNIPVRSGPAEIVSCGSSSRSVRNAILLIQKFTVSCVYHMIVVRRDFIFET